MKKLMMVSALLSTLSISGLAHAADFKTLTTTTSATPSVTSPSVAPAPKAVPAPKKSSLLKGARVVPDTTPAPTFAKDTVPKSDQGYSDMSAYNVVNDQNKPITNDWTRPKSWRIGYKNKNRTPINE